MIAVKFDVADYPEDQGIVLIVSFMPGLKVDAVPLLRGLEVGILCLILYNDFM